MPKCAKCGIYACHSGELDKLPPHCPIPGNAEIFDRATTFYNEDPLQLACRSSRVESAGYTKWPRIREIMEFAKSCGFRKLGLAFCVGLKKEAPEINRIFEEAGFEVESVACKTGSRPKEDLGITDEEKVHRGKFEAMCNPAAQAMLLNEAKTEMNVLLGLCVGHDTLFIKHSDAPVTVLAVKDRVTGHNPLAAIYASHYFKSRMND